MENLKGKVAVLTGASRGIGPHIARALAKEGVNLVIVARTAHRLGSVARELIEIGVQCLPVQADVTKKPGRNKIIDKAIGKFGRIDILINNAALGHFAEFAKQDEDQISNLIDTNFKAPMLLTRAALPHMLQIGSGHIVNMGSLSGKKGLPYLGVYSGTKTAIMEWSNALGVELEGTGIDVSTVCPTYVSKAGMFARFRVKPPKLIGSVPAEAVAKAVVHAIRHNKQEMLLSPIPIRPLLVVFALIPRLGNLLLKLLGVVKINRDIAVMEAANKNSNTDQTN